MFRAARSASKEAKQGQMLIAYSVRGATYMCIAIAEHVRICKKAVAYKEDVLLNFVSPAHMEPYGGPWGLFKRFQVLVYNVLHPGLKPPCLRKIGSLLAPAYQIHYPPMRECYCIAQSRSVPATIRA